MRLDCNKRIFFYSIIIVILSIFISSYLHYNYFNRPSVPKFNNYSPIFEDLIATDIDSHALWYPVNSIDKSEENIVLNNLNALLASNPIKLSVDTTKQAYNFRNEASTSEIMNVLNAAITFRSTGKTKKALRLFQHAAAIAPNNPDVLNMYGEFLEEIGYDVVAADELYLRALTYEPTHQAAAVNYRRTSPVVDRLDLQLLDDIDMKKDYLKGKFDHQNFETLKKQAYYLHIYHTVGIEGNTMTMEEMRALLETGRAIPGKTIVEHNEVLGLQLALKYVKVLSRKEYITVRDILEMHKRVMGHVDPISAGEFRRTKVFVGSHIPPPSEQLSDLMEAYVNWLNSDEAKSMHPVRYAALAHYKLVDIHPFVDGNGRTSRLIMNLILLRGGYPPITILKEQRKEYYNTLNIANMGDVRPFVRFIAHSTLQILDMYIYGTKMLALDDRSANLDTIEL